MKMSGDFERKRTLCPEEVSKVSFVEGHEGVQQFFPKGPRHGLYPLLCQVSRGRCLRSAGLYAADEDWWESPQSREGASQSPTREGLFTRGRVGVWGSCRGG